jgi:hypothetical protein
MLIFLFGGFHSVRLDLRVGVETAPARFDPARPPRSRILITTSSPPFTGTAVDAQIVIVDMTDVPDRHVDANVG